PLKDIEAAQGISAKKENPDCPECGSKWVTLKSGRHGKYWDCEKCDYKESVDKKLRGSAKQHLSDEKLEELKASPPSCPDGHGEMKLLPGKFGSPFWGCRKYPSCRQSLSMKRHFEMKG
ncbi:MAG: topoisomerase DNA-binding C4 zinc finger domain-containing protein, partial [Gammaproteobacteria bacterium]